MFASFKLLYLYGFTVVVNLLSSPPGITFYSQSVALSMKLVKYESI